MPTGVTARTVVFDGSGTIHDVEGPIRRPHTSLSTTSYGKRFGTGNIIWPGQCNIGDAWNVIGSAIIAPRGGVTIRLAATASTGTVTVAPTGMAMVLCVGANEYVVCGAGCTIA